MLFSIVVPPEMEAQRRPRARNTLTTRFPVTVRVILRYTIDVAVNLIR